MEELESKAIEHFDLNVKPGLVAELRIAESRGKRLCRKASEATDVSTRQEAAKNYQEAEADCAKLKKQLEAAPHWKVADITKEAFAVIMASQPGEAVASMSSEARGIFSIIKGKYSKEGGDEDFYCSAYSGDSLTVDRIGRERVVLRRPCLTVLWMVQPDAARKAFADDAFVSSGLIPRFLIFDTKAEPQERTKQPDPIQPKIKLRWTKLIRLLINTYRAQGDTPHLVHASPEAMELFTDYENENVRRRRSDGDLQDMASFVARWTENAWKLALVLHAARHGAKAHTARLDHSTAADGIEVMRWFSIQQLHVLSTRRREGLSKRLLALLAILATGKDRRMKFRELRRIHRFEESEIRHLYRLWPDKFRIIQLRNGALNPSFAAVLE